MFPVIPKIKDIVFDFRRMLNVFRNKNAKEGKTPIHAFQPPSSKVCQRHHAKLHELRHVCHGEVDPVCTACLRAYNVEGVHLSERCVFARQLFVSRRECLLYFRHAKHPLVYSDDIVDETLRRDFRGIGEFKIGIYESLRQSLCTRRFATGGHHFAECHDLDRPLQRRPLQGDALLDRFLPQENAMHESRFGVLKMLEYHWDRKQYSFPSVVQDLVAAGGEIAAARTEECERHFVWRHLRQCAPNFIVFDFFRAH